jgi:VWFA-related protein
MLSAEQPPAQQPPAQQPPTEQPPPPAAQTLPAQPADQQQPPRIRTGINYVRVDVIVSDSKGNPVLDLKPEDFSVTEDNKPQSIESFSLVKIDEATQVETRPPAPIRNPADEEREAARTDVRMFVILLDDYHVRRGNDMASRQPLTDFIQNQLAPADMVALMYPLTPVSDLHFSRDRDALVGAIQRFEGRKGNYQPRNAFEEQYAYYPVTVVERIRRQVTMDALKGAAIRMSGLREGRKSIILVSEGFTATIPTQLQDPIAAQPGRGNPNRNNPFAAQPTDRDRMLNDSDMIFDMRQVFDTLNRHNTSIYAVDPRGLAVFEYGIEQSIGLETDRQGLRDSLDTLHVLAANTDGRAIVNRNDLATGMKQIIRDASGYYLLGYNSSQAPRDGKFHEIKVRVKRSGVEIRARKGYWAYTEEEAARASAPPKPEAPSAVTSALSSLAEPSRGRAARFWVGTGRAASGASLVTFVWEPVAGVPGGPREDPPARVFVTATAGDGRQLYRGRIAAPSSAPSSAGAPATGTPPASATPPATAGGNVSFEAPPGPVQMRLIVEGERGQIIDSTVREVSVPDFTQVDVTLGTPRVYRARTLREMQALKGATTAIPVVDREFSRTERMLIRVDAYGPGGTRPTITARLLNRGGQPMTDLPVQAGATGSTDVELTLASLAANDYVVEITAKGEASAATEFVAFRVGR